MRQNNLAEELRLNPEESAEALPEAFLDWQLDGRREIFGALERGEFPTTFACHLPAVSTLGTGAFPIHCANKGVGLLPTAEALPGLLQEIHDCMQWADGRDWRESQARRIATARALYDHRDRVDPRCFGLIEIFRGQTFRNIERCPQATLLFTGIAPGWRSYQVNCVAEVVRPDDMRFQYILGMRELFERDRFHVQQPDYPLGYILWVNEVIEKTPRFGDAGRKLVGRNSR